MDLGGKAQSLKEKNQARAQFAGAPLLVAQVGEMEFRKKMIEGDTSAIQGLHMGTQTTVAELLKILGKLPSTTVLHFATSLWGIT